MRAAMVESREPKKPTNKRIRTVVTDDTTKLAESKLVQPTHTATTTTVQVTTSTEGSNPVQPTHTATTTTIQVTTPVVTTAPAPAPSLLRECCVVGCLTKTIHRLCDVHCCLHTRWNVRCDQVVRLESSFCSYKHEKAYRKARKRWNANP